MAVGAPYSSTPQEHVVTIRPETDSSLTSSTGESGVLFRSLSSPSLPQGVPIGETLSRSLSVNSFLRGQPSFHSDASTSFARLANTLDRIARQRTSPLNSDRLWITIEFINTITQIMISILLYLEQPPPLLQVWLIGYAAGCLATLPPRYWHYTHRFVRSREQNPLPQASSSQTIPSSGSVATSYRPLSPSAAQGEVSQTVQHLGFDGQDSVDIDRFGVVVQGFKLLLDCFFVIWFVVGNVWIFGGHSSSSEASNLYRLAVFILALSCIVRAMPSILCATICCCLPCIIVRFREYSHQPRGASTDVISALPTYKFEAKISDNTKANKDESKSDSEGGGDGVVVAPGTGKERQVSAEDAACRICLCKYGDGVELMELPCTHHFHIECADKWLKINASCPLCKHEVGEAASASNANSAEPVGGSGDQPELAAIGCGPVGCGPVRCACFAY